MPIANILATALGFVVAAIGVLGIAAPSVLVEYARLLQSTDALHVVAAVRILFGVIIFWAAPNSRTPRIFRALGVLIVIAGLLTPFSDVERSRAMMDWWSSRSSSFTRAALVAAVAFGLFIAYSATPRRPA